MVWVGEVGRWSSVGWAVNWESDFYVMVSRIHLGATACMVPEFDLNVVEFL